MSLLFNKLSRLTIAFLPRSKCLLILRLQSPSAAILRPPKIKPVIVSPISPSICHELITETGDGFTQKSLVKAMVFPVVMDGCESWTIKKAERRSIDAFELWCWRRLESPLDCKEIQPVHSRGDQPWVFFVMNDAKAETPVFSPPHGKS